MMINERRGRIWVLAIACCGIAACAVPAAPIIGAMTGSTTVSGSVQQAADNSRVGLFGAPQAGGEPVELNSAVIKNGQYTLTFPAAPPISLMEQPDETRSVVCSLRVYVDANSNQRYDEDESLGQASGPTFRYFSEASSGAGHAAGWNVFRNGSFSKATLVSASLSYSLAQYRR